MFGQAYFGASYWGGAYWGKGTAGGAAAPVDLIDALARYLSAQPAALSLTGIYNGGAGTGAASPYLVLQESGSRLIRSSSTAKTYRKAVTLKFYSPDLDAAGRIGDALRPGLIQQSLRWAGGRAHRPVEENRRHLKEPGRAADGAYRYALAIDYVFRVRIGVINGA